MLIPLRCAFCLVFWQNSTFSSIFVYRCWFPWGAPSVLYTGKIPHSASFCSLMLIPLRCTFCFVFWQNSTFSSIWFTDVDSLEVHLLSCMLAKFPIQLHFVHWCWFPWGAPSVLYAGKIPRSAPFWFTDIYCLEMHLLSCKLAKFPVQLHFCLLVLIPLRCIFCPVFWQNSPFSSILFTDVF